MNTSFFSKPLSQLECRDNKKSCHLLEKKGTHPMRMNDNNTTCNRSNQNAGFLDTTNTTCNRSNQNAGFLDTTNTTCNRSNQNARLPDTHSRSTNQHPATPDTTKTTCYRSTAQCWKAFLVNVCNEFTDKCNQVIQGQEILGVIIFSQFSDTILPHSNCIALKNIKPSHLAMGRNFDICTCILPSP